MCEGPTSAWPPWTPIPPQGIVGGPSMSRVMACLVPHGARGVQAHGSTEMGYDDDSRACVRALDIDGMIEEG
jgi:hypothetical protein